MTTTITHKLTKRVHNIEDAADCSLLFDLLNNKSTTNQNSGDCTWGSNFITWTWWAY